MNNKYKSEPDYFPVNIEFIAHWEIEKTMKMNAVPGILEENSL